MVMLNLCSTCRLHLSRPGQRNCASCHRAAQKKYRAGNPRKDSAADKARSYASVYVRRGKLAPPEQCEYCGLPYCDAIATQLGARVMLHVDYDRPLVVLFVHDTCARIARLGGLDRLDLTVAEHRAGKATRASASTLCTRCLAAERQPNQRWCSTCRKDYNREHRVVPTGEARQRAIARSYAQQYLKRGKLTPPTECELCFEPGDLHMHHPDYERPLLVVWLHPGCHSRVHAEGLTLDLFAAEEAERTARTRAPRRSRAAIRAAGSVPGATKGAR